jgi:uncharacterized protein
VTYLVVCAVALFASALTFFSGFALGTLLLPAFALFFPLEAAVASTAVVHFLNGIFKLVLVGRHASARVVARFGIPAVAAAFAGAWVLTNMARAEPLVRYSIGARTAEVTVVKIVIGGILLSFAVLELMPWFQRLSFPPRLMPVGGLASGFLGGLSGLQGALRTAFLVKAGLSKEAFIATGVVIAVFVDVARLSVYARSFAAHRDQIDVPVLVAATFAALAGALLGNSFLKKLTMARVQRIVAAMLAVFSIALIAGVI